jgi:uncharacterized protein YbjT (DUF2867 family)
MILVMGASGTVGSEVVRALGERNAAFRAAYRDEAQAAQATKDGVETVILDYAKPETLEAALHGVEKLFFVTSATPDLATLEGNVVEAARKSGCVKHLVKSSVWGAEGEEFVFSHAHREVERKIEASGLAYTFLRPNGFMQNMLGQAASIKAHGVFYLPANGARVSEIDARDIGRVAMRVLIEEGHEGKAYDLSGPAALSNAERAEVLSEVLGKKIECVSPPDEEWKKAVMGFGMKEWQADGIIDLAHYYGKGKAERVSPAVRELTGREPVSYRSFVQAHSEAFR